MVTAASPAKSYLRCPECGEPFKPGINVSSGKGRERKALCCSTENHCFAVSRAVPNLLPPRYSKLLKAVKNGKAPKPTSKRLEVATEWLAGSLGMDLDPNEVKPRDEGLRKLLAQLAILLETANDAGVSQADVCEMWSILSSEAMSFGYKRHVADPAVASLEAVNYEKYEDILLRKAMTSCLSKKKDVALIELGSGPGRLLHQYGSTISPREDACEVYRRLGPQLYEPESLPDREYLRLLLGIDFAQDMLQKAAGWLKRDRLGDLVDNGTISQVRTTVRDLPVTFKDPEWRGTTRIACILFQTLGNQIGREAQLDMLRVARELVGRRGVVFVSVFNACAFQAEGSSYYSSIKGSVGVPWFWDERAFLSKRGVYSKWFYPDELRSLFDDAGMSNATILDDGSLSVFPEFGEYISLKKQKRYKRRALVGVYSRGLDISLTE
jgi:hypothetical protein